MNDSDAAVLETVLKIARTRDEGLAKVSPEQALIGDLGLESLDLAEIVATLEMKLGRDPFAEDVAIASIRTVGDLCRAYAPRGR